MAVGPKGSAALLLVWHSMLMLQDAHTYPEHAYASQVLSSHIFCSHVPQLCLCLHAHCCIAAWITAQDANMQHSVNMMQSVSHWSDSAPLMMRSGCQFMEDDS